MTVKHTPIHNSHYINAMYMLINAIKKKNLLLRSNFFFTKQKNTGPKSKLHFSVFTYLRWFISSSPPWFFPGPQLCLRNGENERTVERKREAGSGTSVSLSLASSSCRTSSELSAEELGCPTLAVSSVEEQETDTSLVLSPPPTASWPWARNTSQTQVNQQTDQTLISTTKYNI